MAGASDKENKPQSKQFGKGKREVPHYSQKAPKYYPAEDQVIQKKKARNHGVTKYRSSLIPGTVLILLAGRFRGKRVVLLKTLDQGVLLVTGPFKVNGVPLRRVNARYVIATSAKVDLKGIDDKTVEKVTGAGYFSKEKKSKDDKSEEAFFKQGEKPQKKEIASSRVEDQKAVDKPLLKNIANEPHMKDYLAASFSLRKGDRPHSMVF